MVAVDNADEGKTTPLLTVLDCALDLDLPEALGIADSALRRDDVSREELTDAIQTLPRIGRERAAVVVRSASEVSVNPFESGLRGLAIEATGPCGSRSRPSPCAPVGHVTPVATRPAVLVITRGRRLPR